MKRTGVAHTRDLIHTMLVTDIQYEMQERLKEKVDLMIKRFAGDRKLDAWLVIDGEEGFGKSEMATGVAYYVHHETKRELSVSNYFFNIDDLRRYAQSTEEKIIVWDEAALGGLSEQWNSKVQQFLIQIAMTCRKKRHFFILCIPKFHKLREYLILDRSVGLIHVYSRDQFTPGRFTYYTREAKERLFEAWRKFGKKDYKKYASFHGTFPAVMDRVIDVAEYDRKKDEGIMSIGNESKENKKLLFAEAENALLKKYLATLPGLSTKEKSEFMQIPSSTIKKWENILETPRNSLKKQVLEVVESPNKVNTRGVTEE